MKLKGLPNRLYNVLFHTHTVSGIVISFALYIIFFAGAFTIFKDEFYQWENKNARIAYTNHVDYADALAQIKKIHPNFTLKGYNYFTTPTEEDPLLKIAGYEMMPDSSKEYIQLLYNPVHKKLLAGDRYTSTTIGETLYRLHFLDQLPYVGRWLAGFTALFFLFAIVTGVLIHWKNILSKFYGFSLKGGLKQLWTSAHTTFGMISLPFQLIYAVTGAYYLLTLLVMAPIVMVFYQGDQSKLFKDIIPSQAIVLSDSAAFSNNNLKIAWAVKKLEADYPKHRVSLFNIINLDKENALLNARIESPESFTGDGMVSIYLKNGKKTAEVIPGAKPYYLSVLDGITRLHFVRFGGMVMKSIFFILAIFTCFVIISGVLLWKEARNKKNYTIKQKKFHHRVTMVYLSICFSLFPATAILFSAQQICPYGNVGLVKSAFFISWFILALGGLFLKTEIKLTKANLLLGGVFAAIVPVVNGAMTKDWIWQSLNYGQYFVAATDLFWIITALLSFTILYKIAHK